MSTHSDDAVHPASNGGVTTSRINTFTETSKGKSLFTGKPASEKGDFSGCSSKNGSPMELDGDRTPTNCSKSADEKMAQSAQRKRDLGEFQHEDKVNGASKVCKRFKQADRQSAPAVQPPQVSDNEPSQFNRFFHSRNTIMPGGFTGRSDNDLPPAWRCDCEICLEVAGVDESGQSKDHTKTKIPGHSDQPTGDDDDDWVDVDDNEDGEDQAE